VNANKQRPRQRTPQTATESSDDIPVNDETANSTQRHTHTHARFNTDAPLASWIPGTYHTLTPTHRAPLRYCAHLTSPHLLPFKTSTMDPTHRKIELQSPADLVYIHTKIRHAALSKLNLHLPPVADTSAPDDLRAAVEAAVEAFVAAVLSGVKSNVSVNGMEMSTLDDAAHTADGVQVQGEPREEFEAFDEKLRARLAKAVQRRDALVKDISVHRRETALQAAGEWQARFEAEAARGVGAAYRAPGDADGDVGGAVEVDVPRLDEVERSWERAVEGLARLNKGLPETRARLERAGDVVGYLGA
jgi:kinetochor protein Mis14/NSL1